MNSRSHELWYVGDNPGAFIPSRGVECARREVTEKELDAITLKIPAQCRYQLVEMTEYGIQNLFVPKNVIRMSHPEGKPA